ncbi:hypothetical protein BFP72_11900 [Reichenbachiella sp. 5M10]|nr:hypothetical protein BFP72_11900 [Reichenbachiella sp. 5M10]
MSQQVTDHQLVEQIKKGDKESFTLLVNRHKRYALTIASRILLVDEDAEEVAHDAFVKAYLSLSRFKSEAKFTTWFYRIVVNLAISRVRKRKLDTVEIQEAHHHLAVSSDDIMEQQDKQFYLNRAIAALSQDDRLIVTLYYLDELDMEEVAEISGFDRNNLKVKLHRARKRLAKTLQSIMPQEIESIVQ